jgi:hypothetical protein
VIDAVIVPTIHTAASVASVRIAQELGSELILLSSPAGPVPAAEIARKRNLGLRRARACDWQRIMFLDDDIILNPEQVADAARALDDYPAVGWRITDYPDHSVLYHAASLIGLKHEHRISGGALMLDMTYPWRDFLPIYNEDWFFLNDVHQAGGVGDAGAGRQLPYNPFVPKRARQEEFGDLIAEGLYRGVDYTTEEFWLAEISLRKVLQDKILAAPVSAEVKLAVQASADELHRIDVADVMSFVRGYSSAGRAPALHAGGQGFESP